MPLLPPDQQLLAELKAHYYRLSRNPAEYGIELCKLCRRSSVDVGLFVPFPETDLAQWIGTPEGKLRGIPYGICKQCFSLGRDAWNARLEQVMRKEFHPAKHRQAHAKHAVDFDFPAADPQQEAHTQVVPEGVTTGSSKTPPKPVALQATPKQEQYAEAIAMVTEHRREFGMEHCTLCRRRADSVCIFLPDEGTDIAERIGLPRGKIRGILYALCGQCLSLPSEERMLRVELSIMQGPRITLGPELPEM